ncbi:hypothetical protein K443DRAFT_107129 [Laccaria amethystina LaAM-08-1]|uniref:Uncharacterized protein n=1 Tax=Laccaria amethystina LaAM-08-1 TaxID=1095629 RepID=A0A0C9XFW8_9AGAR|nr:hypothetical protein K443DRAFT_107129 [Laccaria amethystina LaAM-08-1]
MIISKFVYIYLPTASQVRLQKFVVCAFLIRKVCSVRFLGLQKVCSVRFFDYKFVVTLFITKVCSVRFFTLQNFIVSAFFQYKSL